MGLVELAAERRSNIVAIDKGNAISNLSRRLEVRWGEDGIVGGSEVERWMEDLKGTNKREHSVVHEKCKSR